VSLTGDVEDIADSQMESKVRRRNSRIILPAQ
jgi:hypothetical protein